MKKTWKKTLSIFLTLSMVTALAPTVAWADNEGINPALENTAGPGQEIENTGDNLGNLPTNEDETQPKVPVVDKGKIDEEPSAENEEAGAADVTNQATTFSADFKEDEPEAQAETADVAEVNGTKYDTLVDAMAAAAQKSGTDNQVTVTLLTDAEGDGIVVPSNSNIVLDLNDKEYNVSGGAVGSSGTETNGFQLLKDSDITIKNGTLKATSRKVQILIQNYSNLTLENVIVDGRDLKGAKYAMSNNFGNTVVKGSSEILAANDGVAFDLWYSLSNAYADGVKVVFASDFNGKVEGKIEYGSNKPDATDWETKTQLEINGKGTFDSEIAMSSNGTTQPDNANIVISGGTFSESALATVLPEYISSGVTRVLQEDGSFEVKEKPAGAVDVPGEENLCYENATVADKQGVVKIGDTYFDTLENAIAKAQKGDTIELLNDVKVDGVNPIKLAEGVNLNGGGKTITATGNWDVQNYKNVITVEGSDVTISNLTVDCAEAEVSGIHVYNAKNVALDNVEIINYPKAGVIVNSSTVTATNLTTKGAEGCWGSVNVDDKAGSLPKFTFESGNLQDNVQIYDEVETATPDNPVVVAPSLTNEVSVNGKSADMTFYTDDVSKLGSVYNEDTKTVYDKLEDALTAAEDGQTVSVVKDTELTNDATVKEGVTLVVEPDVTLTIPNDKTLTNNGTIDEQGTITGNVEQGTSGTQITYRKVTFTVKPSDATITVKGSDGTSVSIGNGEKATLKDGVTYTWTATRSNYRSQSGTIAADEDEISITLKKKKSSSSSSSSSSEKTYAVSKADVENGKVKVDPTKAEKGDKVTITVTPDKGYEINKVRVTDADGNKIDLKDKGNGEYTFTMPDSKVEVKATFTKAEETPVEPEVKTIVLTINQLAVSIFGETKINDVAPIIRNDRTMLPIRVVAEALGATVAWDDAQNKVTITKDELTIEIFIGSPFAKVNGNPVQLDSPAFIENSRTYLPIRFVAENLGADVAWDQATQQVTITPDK